MNVFTAIFEQSEIAKNAANVFGIRHTKEDLSTLTTEIRTCPAAAKVGQIIFQSGPEIGV